MSPIDLIAEAKRDVKRIIAGFRQLLSLDKPPLEFIDVGKPDAGIVSTGRVTGGRHGIQRGLVGSVALPSSHPAGIRVVLAPAGYLSSTNPLKYRCSIDAG